MTTQTVRKSHPRFPGTAVSLALTGALGVAAALALVRPWEGGSEAPDNSVVVTVPGVSLAEMTRLELLQHEAFTEAVFGPVPTNPTSLADALAQHEALTDAVFGSLVTEAAGPGTDSSAYPYLADFVARYHPWTDGWLAPVS